MCGINGIVALDAQAAPVDAVELERTREALRSRGPDGWGQWLAPDGRVGLAHRRLAIIDLSDAGRQPMADPTGRLHIVFNGEIYNYRELRRELAAEGRRFRSHSDTEVLLALYEREGPDMLARLRGMFALALWDERERTLFLARDPYGIKPLYYAAAGGTLRFASQVKALEAGGAVSREVDPAGLAGFLLWGSVPEPLTFRRAIRALPAGHYLLARRGGDAAPRAYHDFARAAAAGPLPEPAAALADSVRAHLVADVPVGVFLSAGLDSGLIAALARRAAPEPPMTFTLAFDAFAGTPADEAPLAAAVARALGTRHVERRVGRDEFLDLWPAAIAAMDQPSVDGFNTFVVSRVAHAAGLKVVLSGLGGDELLGGYPSFREVPRWAAWARALGRLPGAAAAWPGIARRLRADKPKLAAFLGCGGSLPGAYFLRRALFLPQEVARFSGAAALDEGLAAYDPLADAAARLDGAGPLDGWRAVHLLESTMYMRNQLLRDADWASMAHSLELRVPLVDPWLRAALAAADFAPARMLGKAALVRRAAPELPAALFSRPKSGFSIPVLRWIDESLDPGASPGAASRRLALRVLGEFGVALGADGGGGVAGLA